MHLSEHVRKFGNTWGLDVNRYFENLLEPLQAERNAQYTEIRVEKDVKYGSHERHRVDIYAPSSATETSRLPVVVYFHGGGFAAGDNSVTPSLHANIGYFFAANGCIGVLATYRLLPSARFPEGAEDVAAALTWLSSNISAYGGDGSLLYPIGQSAGGAHLATALFTGLLTKDSLSRNIQGVIFQSVPLWYNLGLERRRKNMTAYHATQSEEEIGDKSSLGLFEKASKESIDGYPNLLFMVGEYDPDEIVDGNLAFVGKYRTKMKRLPVLEVLAGHNHISYALSIGLDDSTVGQRLLAFVKCER